MRPISKMTVEEAKRHPKVIARFWAQVLKTDSCWLWQGQTNIRGYGVFHIRRVGGRAGKAYAERAHNFSYELLIGDIPEGLYLDHLCRICNCVNPAHLEPVTHRENVLRGVGPTSQNAKKTHCPRGHSFKDHGITNNRGSRECRICNRERGRERARLYRERKKNRI